MGTTGGFTQDKGKALLVLVVDDHQDSREMVVDLLRFHGFLTAQAATGLEAIEKAHQLRPMVILMDLAMPVLDGWSATARLKSGASTKSIPIIVLTAYAVPDYEKRAWKAGCDGIITKPVNSEELVREIGRVLGAGGKEAPAGSTQS